MRTVVLLAQIVVRSPGAKAGIHSLDIGRIAGVPAMPGFTAPKLLWLARHEPDALERTATVLPAKDFIRYRLTGERITDMSE